MDSQTKSPATSDTLAAMLHNTTIDNIERTCAGQVAGGNSGQEQKPVLEFHDVIDYLLNAVPFLVAEVRKNEQSRSTVGETTGTCGRKLVPKIVATPTDRTPHPSILEDISDVVSSDPPSLPQAVASIADQYTRTMLKCLVGYPLYDPRPLRGEYLSDGVIIGDVGFIKGDGTFDLLFNVCPSKNWLINPPLLPSGFSLESPEHSATQTAKALPRKTCLFQSSIRKTNSSEYTYEGSEREILELPEGATQEEAIDIRPFAKLAARYGIEWYEYALNKGRDILNGSLYLITGYTKCSQRGIAVFDRFCAPGRGEMFDRKTPFHLPGEESTSKYLWEGSRAFPTKVADTNQGDSINQHVFLRGYKIMIRQDIFDKLCNSLSFESNPVLLPSSESSPQVLVGSSNLKQQRAHYTRGGGGNNVSKGPSAGELLTLSAISSVRESVEAILHPNLGSALAHPSDVVNAALLSQNPDAKVALTHDDVWCDLLQNNFPKLDYATLIDIARLYTSPIGEYGCVSLVKIYNPNDLKFLDESGYPHQGTETTALQRSLQRTCLTTLDEDYTLVLVNDLPRELVERIFLLLDIGSLLTCRLVNRNFNEIIKSSTLLQYVLACKAAGVIDNPRSLLSYGERLEVLRKREDAWRKLQPLFEKTIEVKLQPSTVYGLTAGTYLLLDDNWKDLHYCHLPSSPQDNPKWIKVPGHGPGQSWSGIFIMMGMAVYEHDLRVNVISSEDENQEDVQRHSLDLVFLKFSTGDYHPLAIYPLIHVQRSPLARPRITVRIVGDNLAMAVSDRDGTFPDKLFIFDWKTGHKRLEHETTENAYSNLVFISPELLLVPNFVRSHFEVWHLPSTDPPLQILSLKLPAVSPGFTLPSLFCHGEPSPFVHSIPYFPPRPFFPDPENSIIISTLLISFLRDEYAYVFVMNCRALLDTIQKWTSSSLSEQDQPTWWTNEVSINEIHNSHDGSVKLYSQSKLISVRPHPRSSPQPPDSPISATSSISSIFADFGSSISSTSTSTSRYNFLQVQWKDWGPPVSRWFETTETQARVLAISNGQRCAFLFPDLHDNRKSTVSVADFNPHNIKRNAQRMTQLPRKGKDHSSDNNNAETEEEEREEELERLDHEDVFAEEVYMGLKCTIYQAPGAYEFDQLLMDEERLLGLKIDREGRDESIRVLYFG